MASGTSISRVTAKRTLVAGLGNILLGDEGAGVRAVEELQKRRDLPQYVSLVDGGTAGYALIDLMKGYDRLIIIDAVRGGGPPGSIYRLLADDIQQRPELRLSGHQIALPEVLLLAARLGELPETLLLGIEPQEMEYGLHLSDKVNNAVQDVIRMVFEEVEHSPPPARAEGA